MFRYVMDTAIFQALRGIVMTFINCIRGAVYVVL
jgi:hypothetical protein